MFKITKTSSNRLDIELSGKMQECAGMGSGRNGVRPEGMEGNGVRGMGSGEWGQA